MRYLIVVSLLLAASASQAVTVTMDFEGVVADTADSIPIAPYVENGLVLNSALQENGLFGKDASFLDGNSNGSAVFGWCSELSFLLCGQSDLITITQEAGAEFDLLSLDVAAFHTSVAGPMVAVGNYAGGGSITIDLVVSDTSWQTYLFDAQWTGLSSLELYGDRTLTDSDLLIDNVVVNTIPIPAAVWLFGSALAGLGWVRRKQTV
jgi:hypothetical protein